MPSTIARRSSARSAEAIAYRKWYSCKEWLDRREQQLLREPYCAMCEEEGKQKLATVADHKRPHKGDWKLFIDGELQSLCSQHHNSVKQSQDRSGIRRGFNEEGMPLDPSHPWYASEARK